MRARISPTRDDVTGASTRWPGSSEDGKVTLAYRPVHTEPLLAEKDGGISLAKIAPKARVY